MLVSGRRSGAARLDLQASEEKQDHDRAPFLGRQVGCQNGGHGGEEDDAVEEDVQGADDDARLFALQLALAGRMAHADPAGQGPDVPDGDEANGNPAADLGDALALVQANVGLGKGDLDGCNRRGPANVEGKLHLDGG